MKRWFGRFAISVLMAIASGSSLGAIASRFDTSLEGWTGNPSDDTTAISHSANGGNPGGFLMADDTFGINAVQFLLAPAPFLGDLSSLNAGTLSLDAILLFSSGAPAELFGGVTITGASGSAFLDIALGALPTSWTRFSAPLIASAWGKSQIEWTAILADVTSIRIELEPIGGAAEILGVDNIAITPVPEPHSYLLMCAGLIGVAAYLRSRRQRVEAGKRS